MDRIIKKADLKPCPFCGREAVVEETHRYPRNRHSVYPVKVYTPVCLNMDCIIYKADNQYYKTIRKAVEMWNKRGSGS